MESDQGTGKIVAAVASISFFEREGVRPSIKASELGVMCGGLLLKTGLFFEILK
jgi:hypothetical protein